jgi:predicted NAD-dependent protein-ADP-ribosyltransferase YbiA (DUF1768 family)
VRTILKDTIVALVPDGADELALVRRYLASHENDVYELVRSGKAALALRNLGPRPEACREPINIGSRVANPQWRPISNFAHTPFVLDGRTYAGTESFWQGLKFPDEADRRRIAPLHGCDAKKSADAAVPAPTIVYDGLEIAYGRPEHWALMRRACEAKFGQNDIAREALLSTGSRPLTHRMRHDSRSIPGAIMSEIWMDVRTLIRGKAKTT